VESLSTHPGPDRHDVGAVVLGGDYQGLEIVRSLGRRGIPACVVDDEWSIARFSRYTKRSIRVRSLGDGERTVSTLLDAGRRFGLEGWVLYPTRDETVVALARHRDRVAGFYRVPTCGWETARWACDKRMTYRLTEQLGLAAPRTWYPADAGDLDRIEGEPPLVIKPASRGPFLHETGAKAWRADSLGEAKELFERASVLAGRGEVMVQELIPGDGRQQYAYCALFGENGPVATMVARRRRQHPPEFGRASTFAETVDLPDIEPPSERFLREIGYRGLVELEYKLDPRDGRLKLLDVNARTWGYHGLGRAAGVDFPYLLFRDQLGQANAPCRARPGVRWVRLLTDLPTAALEISRGRLDWREYGRSLRQADVGAVAARDDPVPGIIELLLLPYLFVKRGF
jgi:D-aspartate ligase